MTSIAELGKMVSQLEEKIDNLIIKVDQTFKPSVTTEQMEVIAAKIIFEIQNEIQNCSCNQEVLEQLKNLPTPDVKIGPDYSGLKKYSFPNWNVGNASLGSSGNPKALKWPYDKPQE